MLSILHKNTVQNSFVKRHTGIFDLFKDKPAVPSMARRFGFLERYAKCGLVFFSYLMALLALMP